MDLGKRPPKQLTQMSSVSMMWCSNACKYTQNGSITIYGGWEKHGDDSNRKCSDNNNKPRMLRLECRDTVRTATALLDSPQKNPI